MVDHVKLPNVVIAYSCMFWVCLILEELESLTLAARNLASEEQQMQEKKQAILEVEQVCMWFCWIDLCFTHHVEKSIITYN